MLPARSLVKTMKSVWTTDPDGLTPARVVWALLSVAAVAWFVATAGSVLHALEIGDTRQHLNVTFAGGMLAGVGAHGLLTRKAG